MRKVDVRRDHRAVVKVALQPKDVISSQERE
jgi:hypothetical protein